ncbi:hypothetical protein [Paraburkholderia tagetis]|uniref:Uncharacterized protein n=1 Tax=Paraburkholderia tagetis TaxID=2913261 RepID=A0A9X1RNR2_9BURK|nr:hypothetical protein [Paraburkholderia tagetis]MCG5074520.1 hypothetical protein [Paraburkholderia tagetis]
MTAITIATTACEPFVTQTTASMQCTLGDDLNLSQTFALLPRVDVVVTATKHVVFQLRKRYRHKNLAKVQKSSTAWQLFFHLNRQIRRLKKFLRPAIFIPLQEMAFAGH